MKTNVGKNALFIFWPGRKLGISKSNISSNLMPNQSLWIKFLSMLYIYALSFDVLKGFLVRKVKGEFFLPSRKSTI